MSEPTIRLATPEDCNAVTRLVDSAYEKYIPRIGAKPMPMLSDYKSLIERNVVYVLEKEGQLVGVLVLENEPDHVYIDNIALAPQFQGVGYGKRLMQYVEASARAQGKNEIRL
jgi:N-acetylglutamate synthase-like GNAT family acetyltransferase